METDKAGDNPGPRNRPRERERGLRGEETEVGRHGDINDPDAESAEGRRLKIRQFKLLFDLGRSRRYCTKLAAHYARLEKITTLVSLAAGSAIVVDVFANWPNVQLYGGLVILVMSLANLVFGWPDLARDLRLRHERYTALNVRLNRLGDKTTENDLDEFRGDYTEIEKEESAPKLVLSMICHNEECGARNTKTDQVRIWPHQRWAAYFVSLPPVTWE